jgi:hypothetical protein
VWIAAAMLLAESAYKVLVPLYRILISRAPTSYESIDLSEQEEESEENQKWYDKLINSRYIKRIIVKITLLWGAVWGTVKVVKESTEIWEWLYKEVFERIAKIFMYL